MSIPPAWSSLDSRWIGAATGNLDLRAEVKRWPVHVADLIDSPGTRILEPAVTVLQELIDGASGDAPVPTLLRKVKIVASRADVPALDEWVQHELDGYPARAELPDYRGPFDAEVLGMLTGPLGSGMRNAPIPSAVFPDDYRDGYLFKNAFPQPIAELVELAHADDGRLQAPWPANAVAVVNGLIQAGRVQIEGGWVLQQAWRVITAAQLVAVVDAVRNRILDLALTMEQANPETGQRDAPPLAEEASQTIITNIYGDSTNVAVASENVTQAISFGVGEREGLGRYLESLGVPSTEIESLFTALNADGEVDGEIGPHTKAWLGNLMAGASKLGLGVAGGLIVAAISHYLGIA